KSQRPFQPARTHFRDEYSHTDRERHGKQERQEGGYESAIDEGQCPELLVNRIPLAAEEEFQSEGMPRESRSADQFVNNQADQSEHAQPTGEHCKVEDTIRDVTVASLQERFSLDLGIRRNLLFCNGLRSGQSRRS